jgi:SAM-dependent methyltransferase
MDSNVKDLEQKVLELRVELRQAIERYTDATRQAYIPWAPHPKPEQVAGARVLTDRLQLLEVMPKNSICVEVGTQTGAFAAEILNRTMPRELHVIDVDFSQFKYEIVSKYIEEGTLKIHEGNSPDVLRTFPKHYFDWIYIDGDHAYNGVKEDIEAAKSVLKEDGYLLFNDYTVWSPAEVSPYGILQAVNELWASEPWELAYFALHGQGYHDVCLRRIRKPPLTSV